jgi:NhaP-type Na+/H+ or K+/H+ antiporter
VSPFERSALVFGALLVVGAVLSGVARRSFLSLTALFVLAGFALGEGGTEFLSFDATGEFVHDLAFVALIVILFRDGLEVEAEMLQREWRLPLRKLVLAMPITACLVALVTHALTDLGWTASFLVGALLSPTDPVLSSSVVTNPRVPRRIRHSLNLESGMNDGLALPAVLAFTLALDGDSGFVWWRFVLQDVGLGLLFGVLMGWLSSKALPRPTSPYQEDIPPHQKSLYALGVAFLTFGVALAWPEGNGLIAVFTCAIVLGIRRPDIRHYFEQRADDIVEVVKLGIFVVFGALLTLDGIFTDGLAAVALAAFTLLVARPVAIWISLAGTGLPVDEKAFMAWFGPKGVATMAFSLLVLAQTVPGGQEIFNLAALTVVVSIVAHGSTDTPGAAWIAARAERRAATEGEAGAARESRTAGLTSSPPP